MKKWVLLFLLAAGLAGCQRYEPAPELLEGTIAEGQEDGSGKKAADEEELVEAGSQKNEMSGAEKGKTGNSGAEKGKAGNSGAEEGEADYSGTEGDIVIRTEPERTPVKVKGIYVSAYVAGRDDLMEEIIAQIDRTELNAVVIDVKDDNGRITFAMDSPSAQGIGACVNYIPDIQALTQKLKEHQIYLIARIPAFRDPYLAEVRPDWCCKLADGSVYRDRNKLAWVNPYQKEVWDYLVEIGKKAGEAGFDEIQFDYIRFCTEKGMQNVVFDEAETQGKSRQEIILEFVQYAYDQLSQEGLFVSSDVFGIVMGGGNDAQVVGQDYGAMAEVLDYICPMIYPSHYGDGCFGIAHPDTQPYATVAAALAESKAALAQSQAAGVTVRPWLQDFTASYLKHHISYGPQQVREQIQAVYDAGYEEWILWDAKVTYHYDGLLPEAAEPAPAAEIPSAAETTESAAKEV